jgi:hypothetical protein
MFKSGFEIDRACSMAEKVNVMFSVRTPEIKKPIQRYRSRWEKYAAVWDEFVHL